MCVAAMAWMAHPRWRLALVANRDEWQDRPAAPLAAWDDGSGVIAGRDLRGGGTWLGINAQGRVALVTNYRVPGYPKPDRVSRGGLVTGWLEHGEVSDIAPMNPFNLFLADAAHAELTGNWPEPWRRQLSPGIHGLSNGGHDRPWPKTRQLCSALATWLDGDAEDTAPLFAALRAETPDRRTARAEDGPEPRLAPVFINNPTYGTRCSTVVLIGHDGTGSMTEWRYSPEAEAAGETTISF